MWRHGSRPRDGYLDLVKAQGLTYPETPTGDGDKVVPYWNEAAWYEFTLDEVETIEAATEELWGLCVDAVAKMARDFDDARLGLPAGTMDYARESIRRADPAVYGRFDFHYDGLAPRMLELNGDTPTGLIETGVAQWHWLEQMMPGLDQFNSVHERLVDRWRALGKTGAFPGNVVHFLWNDIDTSGEDEMTVQYMRDCAEQAGLTTYGQPIAHVGWDVEGQCFRDAMGEPIRSAFKLYPWELMLDEEFGQHVLAGREKDPVKWVEPGWKVLMSTKAILPVLWEMNPDHPNLLPAFFDEPGDLVDWIAKPLHGREGDNIRMRVDGVDSETTDGGYGAEGYVYQQWCPLPSYDGNRPMLGSWVIDGQAAGMIVRESDGPVTDYFSRVVPHGIGDGLAPDAAQQAAWRQERTGTDAGPTLVDA